jgi:tetratricopeptide (TPR) repeat protein
MKRSHISIALALLLSITLGPGSALSAEVDWAKGSFAKILEKAAKEKKHVFIDFYAVWCGPCKMLEKTTYKDAKVIEFLNGIIPVKYDAEKGEGLALAKKFKIKAYPTLVLLGPDGKEIDRQIGYVDAANFLKIMKNYMSGVGTIGYFEKLIEMNPKDIPSLYKLGEKYANLGDLEKGAEYLGKVGELDPRNEKGLTDDALLSLGDLYAMNKDYKKAAENFRQLIDRFPDSDVGKEALQMLARVYQKMGETDKCLETFNLLVAKNPEDPKSLNAFAWFCATNKIALDEALAKAQKAVELSHKDPGIMDTLAEVYYARGEYDKAVATEEEAAKKEPDDTYYKDQIIKYLKAALKEAKGEETVAK